MEKDKNKEGKRRKEGKRNHAIENFCTSRKQLYQSLFPFCLMFTIENLIIQGDFLSRKGRVLNGTLYFCSLV